jgi:hypothetical protein
MKLTIDNLDGEGPRDYTQALDLTQAPTVERRLNDVTELRISLVSSGPGFVVPVPGARVQLGKANGADVFTGVVTRAAEFEYLGWGERGPLYRYHLVAQSDEAKLDGKTMVARSPLVNRAAGDILRQLTQELLPGALDMSEVADLDLIPSFRSDAQKKWSEHAKELSVLARGSYRVLSGKLHFESAGTVTHVLQESAATFSPAGLKLTARGSAINDISMVGRVEPQTHVRDYFVGDGLTLRFNLSRIPFTRTERTVVDEEYAGTALRPQWWSAVDPAAVVSVAGGKLQIAGGTGVDGQTLVTFVEKIELGGALVMQHGEISFDAASNGVLGGLYAGGVNLGGCVAGFQVTAVGSQSRLQALVNGGVTGAAITTQSGHRYGLTTRLYAPGVFRKEQTLHSSVRAAGSGRGGNAVTADVRIMLEVHDIDLANPATVAAASTVLYDGVVVNAPGHCIYALVNAASMHASLAFTRLLRAADALVRSQIPGQSWRTRLTGALLDGAECRVTRDVLGFFTARVPVPNELIEVRYRSAGRALARVRDAESVAALASTSDDGVRGVVQQVALPVVRTFADCVRAAEALLDDSVGMGWSGEYQTWSDFLPGGAADIFPGETLSVQVPSRGALFAAIVREVKLEILDLANDRSRYMLRFADEGAEPLGTRLGTAQAADWSRVVVQAKDAQGVLPPDLTAAEFTQVTSTTVTVDAGVTPSVGVGIEVRRSDAGWGPDNDRNLAGRFTTRTFTLPRWSRVQDYFLRLYDVTGQYSRHSAGLHVDYPF